MSTAMEKGRPHFLQSLMLCLILSAGVRCVATPNIIKQAVKDPSHTEDPIVDAQQAIQNRDFRLLCADGYGGCQFIPGVAAERQVEIRNKYAVRVFRGTSDVLTDAVKSRLKYMAKYNAYIITHGK